MSDTMHIAAEGQWEIDNARAEAVLDQFGQFACAVTAAPEPEEIDMQELYAALGLATAVCIESSWSVAGTESMDRAYQDLRRAQERLDAPPAAEVKT